MKELQAYLPDYAKTDEYLSKNNLYRLLEDRLPQAIERAKRLCGIPEDERVCYSEVFKLLELLETLGRRGNRQNRDHCKSPVWGQSLCVAFLQVKSFQSGNSISRRP